MVIPLLLCTKADGMDETISSERNEPHTTRGFVYSMERTFAERCCPG